MVLTATKEAVKLEKIPCGTLLCNDIEPLSELQQTSSVIAFHSVLVQLIPKMYTYSFKGSAGLGLRWP